MYVVRVCSSNTATISRVKNTLKNRGGTPARGKSKMIRGLTRVEEARQAAMGGEVFASISLTSFD